MTGYADLHLHTTASDGTLPPEELVALARKCGLSVISVTDHDTVAGLSEAKRAACDDVAFIPGVEFTSVYLGDGGSFRLHILGYGIDPDSPALLSVIDEGQRIRRRKHSLRLEYLRDVHGIVFSDAELRLLESESLVGKLHIAKLLIKRGLAENIGDAIENFMSASDFPEGCIPHSLVIEGITAAGGVSVYAHPLGGEGEKRLTFSEVSRRIELLSGSGIGGVECYYSRYSSGEAEYLALTAEKLGLLVSGGSDFHGKNKTVKIGELLSEGGKIKAERLSVLSRLVKY
ncbi:MAG: PHP domain-containing protein [Clostridia bacterium]|nr:PHP domain-containing protein [Clostridia bacterium]